MSGDTWRPSDGLRAATDDVILEMTQLRGADTDFLKLKFDTACENLDGNVALMADENRRMRAALKAYVSALRSGEAESDQLRTLADEALREVASWEDWEPRE